MELYRREFEFLQPVMPQDDSSDHNLSGEEDSLDHPNPQADKYQGKNEIINGIEIHTHSLMSPSGFGSKKKPLENNKLKLEETKLNFFVDNKANEEEEESHNQILETKIDPLEWKQEIDRVYTQLAKIEAEVEILKKQGSGDASEYEEYRRHVELIVEMCNDIR